MMHITWSLRLQIFQNYLQINHNIFSYKLCIFAGDQIEAKYGSHLVILFPNISNACFGDTLF